MRVIKEFNYGPFKASIFNWNNKFLLKLETPTLEQVYKFPETEIFSAEELEEACQEELLPKVEETFKKMLDLQRAIMEV